MEDDENWNKDIFWQRFFRACEIAAFDEKKRAQYEQDIVTFDSFCTINAPAPKFSA